MQEANDYRKVEIKTYQRLIRKLNYLSYITKLGIAFVVSQLSKYNVGSQVKYTKATKKMMYYLKNTIYLGLIYSFYPKTKKIFKH